MERGKKKRVAFCWKRGARHGESVQRRTRSEEREARRSQIGDKGLNPMRGFGGAGGSISSRMASKTTLNWASYLFSSAASWRASSVLERSISRKRTNVRMMAMLTRSFPVARSHHHATNTVYPTASPHVVLTCRARELR